MKRVRNSTNKAALMPELSLAPQKARRALLLSSSPSKPIAITSKAQGGISSNSTSFREYTFVRSFCFTMASNYTSRGGVNNEWVNEEGTMKAAQTVDYQSSAGQGQEVKKQGVELIHECHPSEEHTGPGSHGIVGRTADAVSHAAQAAKNAVSGHGHSKKS